MPDLSLLRAALSAVAPRRPTPSRPVTLDKLGVRADPDRLAAYARVCGDAPGDRLPLLYPRVLAFGLAMRLMARRDFPFPLPGLIHVRDVVTRHRAVGHTEQLDLAVRSEPPGPHPKGRTVDVITEARAGGAVLWTERSSYLRRGGPAQGARNTAARPSGHDHYHAHERDGRPIAHWTAGAGIGRAYAAVSGDRNPIHLSALTARPFGFRTAIAHGMWTAARALSELDHQLPDRCALTLDFVSPVPLPSELTLVAGGDGSRFAVRAADGRDHLRMTLTGQPDDQRSPAS